MAENERGGGLWNKILWAGVDAGKSDQDCLVVDADAR